MKIFSAYIVRNVLQPTLTVLLLLTAMIALFDYLDQLEEVGEQDYTALKAALYVALHVPGRLVQLLPVATLIGTVMGLGVMSSNSELTVMRAAGVSPLQIGFAALRAAVLLMVAGAVVSEFVAPEAVRYAEVMRTNALSPDKFWISGNGGTWLRSGSDFVNMARVLSDKRAEEVRIFHVNAEQKLERVTTAVSAQYDGEGRWRLHNGSVSEFHGDHVVRTGFSEQLWQSDVQPENLATLDIDPSEMTGRSLFYYVDYLMRNGLDWRRYDLEFWRKVLQPLNLFAMVLAGIASVFGPLRSVTVSARVLSGVAIGLGFHFMTQLFGPISLASSLPPVLGALIPPVVLLLAAILLLRKAQ